MRLADTAALASRTSRRPPARAGCVPRASCASTLPRSRRAPSTGATSSTCCRAASLLGPAGAEPLDRTGGLTAPMLTYQVTHRTEYRYESRRVRQLRRSCTCCPASSRASGAGGARSWSTRARGLPRAARLLRQPGGLLRDPRAPPRSTRDRDQRRRGRRARRRAVAVRRPAVGAGPRRACATARRPSPRCPASSCSTRRSVRARRPASATTPRASFPPGRAPARRRHRPLPAASTLTSSTARVDLGDHPARRGVRATPGRLPGLRPPRRSRACARSGLAARYVSGYLETVPPPGRPELKGADGSHAWLSVFVPDAGWLDVDPTNDQFVNDRYVVDRLGTRLRRRPAAERRDLHRGQDRASLKVTVDVVPISG